MYLTFCATLVYLLFLKPVVFIIHYPIRDLLRRLDLLTQGVTSFTITQLTSAFTTQYISTYVYSFKFKFKTSLCSTWQ